MSIQIYFIYIRVQKVKGHVKTMALLLAMFQKMRLVREKNQATYELTKYSSKVSRVEKNIARIQKMYTSRIAKIDSQAKQMTSQAKVMFSQAAGLGVNNINLDQSYYYAAGENAITSTYQYGIVRNSLIQGTKDKDGNPINIGEDVVDNVLNYYKQHGHLYKLGEDGKPINTSEDTNNPSYELIDGIDQNQVNLLGSAIQFARYSEGQQRNNVSNASMNYENAVSIWAEAAKEQLEAEQDAVLEPLNYQQTMWELEKEQLENKLTRIKAELESYTNLVKDEAQNAAPKFGLG